VEAAIRGVLATTDEAELAAAARVLSRLVAALG
jgi:hypothetical protein